MYVVVNGRGRNGLAVLLKRNSDKESVDNVCMSL